MSRPKQTTQAAQSNDLPVQDTPIGRGKRCPGASSHDRSPHLTEANTEAKETHEAVEQVSDPITPASTHTLEQQLPVVAWLDPASANALRRLVSLLALGAPRVRAILLFGSVARHDERPLTDPAPSAVDLLVLFDPPAALPPAAAGHGQAGTAQPAQPAQQESLTDQQQAVLSQAVVQALLAFPDAARDFHVTGAIPPFIRWDASFLALVAQDGLLVWAATSPPDLPAPLDTLRTLQDEMQDDQPLGASGASASRG